jgi:hypothetical protein
LVGDIANLPAARHPVSVVPFAADNHRNDRVPARLIFVYNADAGIAKAMLDALHKTLSPSTYPCSLCAITYGRVSMKPRWRSWLKTLPVEAVFYHRDDCPFEPGALPAILIEREGQVTTLVDSARLNRLPDLEALIVEIEKRLREGAGS